MTDVAPRTRRHSEGWHGGDLSKDRVAVDLTAGHLAALDEVMAPIRGAGRPVASLTRADFDHPVLNEVLGRVTAEIKHGGGLVIMRGLPVDRSSLDETEAVYWGIGTHLGIGCSQSPAGDVLGYVTDTGTTRRGYTSSAELEMHTDLAEIVGLLCLRQARAGGANVFANSLTIHRIIEEERPEFLPVLEQGFPGWRRNEQAAGEPSVTPYDMPIFACCGGLLSCRYHRGAIEFALRKIGRSLTPLEKGALDFFDAVSVREGVRFDMQLEPGEAVLFNNYEMLHSRTGFTDWPEPERKRLLFRLWLQGDPPRPVLPEMMVIQNRSGRQGIDAHTS